MTFDENMDRLLWSRQDTSFSGLDFLRPIQGRVPPHVWWDRPLAHPPRLLTASTEDYCLCRHRERKWFENWKRAVAAWDAMNGRVNR